MNNLKDVKSNALYRYERGNGWCKHGIVYTYEKDGILYANDTYWDSEFSELTGSYSSEATTYRVEKVYQDLEFIMMVDDVKALERNKKEEFWQYDEKDRLFIPMGGWHERYLVNKNTEPRKDYIIEQLESNIQSLKWTIESTQRQLEKAEEKLAKLKG